MCGFYGIFLTSGRSDTHIVRAELSRAVKALRRRGPDASGQWVSPLNDIGVAHTLLSITDAPRQGLQPFLSNDNRYVLTFNGEIYNHLDLRKRINSIANIDWKTSTDTESLLQSLIHFGVEDTLQNITGMFAFAFIDLHNRELFLCRDRFGEKPLYLGVDRGLVFFTSVLNARPTNEYFDFTLSQHGLQLYQSCGFIPSPYSIYNNVIKIRPGHFAKLSFDTSSVLRSVWDVTQHCWWSFDKMLSESANSPIPLYGSISAIEGELRRCISGQISKRLDTAVLLSGGVDSTLVAAIASEVSDKRLKTFTVGFENKHFDESSVASVTAKKLGTDHENIFLNSTALEGLLSDMGDAYDEPFSDSSQISTMLVSKAIASTGIKTALTGDGGDELFGGYNRHKFTGLLNMVPQTLGALFCRIADRVENISERSSYRIVSKRSILMRQKISKAIKIMSSEGSEVDKYISLLRVDGSLFSVSNQEPAVNLQLPDVPKQLLQTVRMRYMYLDTLFFLPEDLMVKMDRASMAFGLEARAPMLDHRLMECVWRANFGSDQLNISGKKLARMVLKKYLPEGMPPKTKHGFAVPVGEYLTKSMAGWMDDRVNTRDVVCKEILNMPALRSLWNQHRSGVIDAGPKLWHAAVLINWIETR